MNRKASKKRDAAKRAGFWTRFRKAKAALRCFHFLMLEALAVCLLPLLFHMDPVTSDVQAGFYAAPSAAHLLGTDGAARDLLARTLYGGRTSLLVGAAAPCLSVLIGLPLGLVAGYYRGIAEGVILWACDLFMSFPSVLISLILMSVIGPSLPSLVIVIGVMGWPAIARLVYGNVLSIRKKDYIESAMSIGRSDFEILWHDILPEALSPVLISISFMSGNAILQESGLSFLGAGIRPPQASWGGVISAAQDLSILTRMPWVWAPSAILIVLTVISFHFLGEGLRDALDPHMKL